MAENPYEGSKLQKFDQSIQDNPAAPGGLKQTSAATAQDQMQVGENNPYAGSKLDRFDQAGGSLVGLDKSWYTGANMEGVTNSWDTEWYGRAMEQYGEQLDAAAQEDPDTGRADPMQFFRGWLERDDATGVALWDDKDKGVKRGDVYDNGKQVGNVLEDMDEHTANVMMGEWLLSREKKNQVYEANDGGKSLKEAVDAVLDEQTLALEGVLSQQDFQGDVDERKEDLGDKGTAGIVAGGVAGGAATGAGTAALLGTTVLPVAGTAFGGAVGAVAGGIAGGVGALLNRDQLNEQLARGIETVSRAQDQYNSGAASSVALREFGGLGLRFLSPVSNLWQGGYDAIEGDPGDGRSEFYAMDSKTGERKAGAWVRGVDIGASVADGIAQFSGRAAIKGYMAATSGHVVGSLGQMATMQGGWSDRDAKFREYQNAKEWGAALGAVGIDAVQIGMGTAMLRMGSGARSIVTGEKAAEMEALHSLTYRAGERMFGPAQARVAAAEAAGEKAGFLTRQLGKLHTPGVASHQELGGLKFGFDEAGTAVSARMTAQVMAPSEALKYVQVRWLARMRAGSSAPTADDFYRAALEATNGGNAFMRGIVNGWGEGLEEATQAYLEPISFGHSASAGEIAEQAAYGFAGGMGMSLGRLSQAPSGNEFLMWRANTLATMRGREPYTPETWKQLTPAQQMGAAKHNKAEGERIRKALNAHGQAQVLDADQESLVALMAMRDVVEGGFNRDNRNANRNLDTTLVLWGQDGSKATLARGPQGQLYSDDFELAANQAGASFYTVRMLLNNKLLQQKEEEKRLTTQLKAKQAEVAQATDPAAQSKLQGEEAVIAAKLQLLQVTVLAGDKFKKRLSGRYKDYTSAVQSGDSQKALKAIDRANKLLDAAADGTVTDENGQALAAELAEGIRRSLEVQFTRHPSQGPGSHVVLVPRISKALTAANAHGGVAIHQSLLKIIGGDHDGDTVGTLNFESLEQHVLDELRAGLQYFSTEDDSPALALGRNISTRRRRVLHMDNPDGEGTRFIPEISQGLQDTRQDGLNRQARSHMSELKRRLDHLLLPHVEQQVFAEAWRRFSKAVYDGRDTARTEFLEYIANEDWSGLQAAGREHGSIAPKVWSQVSLVWHKHAVAVARELTAAHITEAPHEQIKDATPTKFATERHLAEAANPGQTAAILSEAVDPVRVSMTGHYNLFRTLAVYDPNEGWLPTSHKEFVEAYALWGSDDTGQSARDKWQGRDRIQRRVYDWLKEIAQANARLEPFSQLTPSQSMMVLANTKVSNFEQFDAADGGIDFREAEGEISFLQLLLRRSIQLEKIDMEDQLQIDEQYQTKIKNLERLANKSAKDKDRSTTAMLAYLEVFGDVPLYEYMGEEARYFGSHLTLNQIMADLLNHAPAERRRRLYRLQQMLPYKEGDHKGTPPYDVSEVFTEGMNSFRVAVDVLSAAVQTAPRRMRDADAGLQEQFVANIAWLQDALDRHIKMLGLEMERGEALEHMLANDQRTAAMLADLIPNASKLGAFRILDGNRAVAAKWVKEMFLLPPEQALLKWRVNSWISEWNALGTRVTIAADGSLEIDDSEGASKKDEKAVRAYSRLQSRMMQTFAQLAHQSDGFNLERLLLMMNEATSLEGLMNSINSDPMFVGNRSELLAFFDDVSDFEPQVGNPWGMGSSSGQVRDAVEAMGRRVRAVSVNTQTFEKELIAERGIISELKKNLVNGVGTGKRWEQVRAARTNSSRFGDTLGPRTRDRVMRALQQGILVLHQKGAADKRLRGFGEHLVLVDGFGLKHDKLQALDGVTSSTHRGILANPSLLADGPVLVGMGDGSTTLLDFSTDENLLAALDDPATNQLVKLMLGPAVRDIDGVGNLQVFSDIPVSKGDAFDSQTFGLRSILDNSDLGHMFTQHGRRLTPAQAHRYISHLEAGLRKEALGQSDAAQKEAFFPLQQVLNDFLVAYTHHPAAKHADLDEQQDRLIVDVAMALQQMSALYNQGNHDANNEALTSLQRGLSELLQKRMADRRSKSYLDMYGSEDDLLAQVALFDTTMRLYTIRLEELGAQESQLTQDKTKLDSGAADYTQQLSVIDDEIDRVHKEFERVRKAFDSRAADIKSFMGSSEFDQVQGMFNVTDAKDPNQVPKMVAILDYFSLHNRGNRFTGNQVLKNKLRHALKNTPTGQMPSDDVFGTEDWATLGEWATFGTIAERADRAGSSVKLMSESASKSKWPVAPYYDRTWAYLADGLFNPKLLEIAGSIAEQASWPGVGVVDSQALADHMVATLFSEKRLGEWTQEIPKASMMVRHGLATSPVGLSVPVAGSLPPVLGVYIGASRRTTTPPPTTMLTDMNDPTALQVYSGGAVVWRPDDYTRYENVFATSVRLVDGAGQVVADIIDKVGDVWTREDDWENNPSPYRIISTQRISDALVALAEQDLIPQGSHLEITYLEGDTRPPGEEWVNNVYFDGVGREDSTPFTESLIAEQYVSVGAEKQKGEQDPLDAATRGGSAFMASPVIKLSATQGLSARFSQVSDILRAKTNILSAKRYSTGTPLVADRRSIYKHLKMMHVVVGKDAAGGKVVLSAQDYISHESAGTVADVMDPATASLVPLSDDQFRKLYGDPSLLDKPGVVTKPGLDIYAVPTYIDLTPDYLASVGLERLGETTEARDTLNNGFAFLPPLIPLKWTSDRGRPIITYRTKLRRLRATESHERSRRFSSKESMKTFSEMSSRNARLLLKGLREENLAPILKHLGIPFADVKDLDDANLSANVLSKLAEQLEVNGTQIIWRHTQGVSYDPTEGVLSEQVLKDGFPSDAYKPVFGDIVVVDLDSILTVAGTEEMAIEMATKIVADYARMGVTIALHGPGASNVRYAVGQELSQGRYEYIRLANSAHFFTPLDPDSTEHATQRALSSSLTTQQVFTGSNLSITLVTDFFGLSGSEQAGHVTPYGMETLREIEAPVVVPTQLGKFFGYPEPGGKGSGWSDLREMLLPVLKDPEGRKLVLKKLKDPPGAKRLRVIEGPNGEKVLEPGIRTAKDAIDHLIEILEDPSNHVLKVGNDLATGDIIPLKQGGEVYFRRLGFKDADVEALEEQDKVRVTDGTPGYSGTPLFISAAKGEFEDQWTVRLPGEITGVFRGHLGLNAAVRSPLSPLGKDEAQGDVYKVGHMPMPNDVELLGGAYGRSGVQASLLLAEKSQAAKQAHRGEVTPWKWMFALSGVDFRDMLVSHFKGIIDPTPEQVKAHWDEVSVFLRRVSQMDHSYTADDLMTADSLDNAMELMGAELVSAVSDLTFGSVVLQMSEHRTGHSLTAQERFVQAFVTALLMPGVTLSSIVSTSGLLSEKALDGDIQIKLIHDGLSDILDNRDHPELEKELLRRVNDSFNPTRVNGLRPFYFTEDRQFHQLARDPRNPNAPLFYIDATMRISMEVPSDSDPYTYLNAALTRSEQDVSQHVSFFSSETVGAQTQVRDTGGTVDRIFSGEGLQTFSTKDAATEMWQLMRSVDDVKKDKSFMPWSTPNHAQRLYEKLAASRMTAYFNTIDKSKGDWLEKGGQFNTKVAALISALYGNAPDAKFAAEDVDYMIRMFLGAPGLIADQTDLEVTEISAKAAIETVELMLDNVAKGHIPTYGGTVALWPDQIAHAVYKANLQRTDGNWAPAAQIGKRDTQLAQSYEGWFKASMGQVMESEVEFDSAFRIDLDGMWHTWQGHFTSTGSLATSLDEQVDYSLLSKEVNMEMTSIDPRQDGLFTNPALFDTQKATLDAIVGYDPTYVQETARLTPGSSIYDRLDRQKNWINKINAPKQERITYRNYYKSGAWYVDSKRDTHNFFHSLVNISIGNRLLNPALWVSAFVEVMVRTKMDKLTNLLTGQSTTLTGQALSMVGLSQLTPEQSRKLRKLNAKMGESNKFLKVIYKELTFQNLVEEGRGTFGKWTEKFAATSARITSDPRFGMPATAVAARYNEAALAYLAQTDSGVDFDTYVDSMMTNPGWLEEHMADRAPGTPQRRQFNAHRAGLARVAEVRGMRPTVVGKAFMGTFDLFGSNGSALVNGSSNLLKIPFVFTRFNLGALTSIAGLGGFDQMLAMSLDRRNSKLLGKVRSALSGDPHTSDMDFIDMSDVLEGVDLLRPFARGAVTHTGLMALAVGAGSMGLGGEDEESRRRRRLAQWLNLPVVYDARKIENDFRYKDALFLDALPEWLPGAGLIKGWSEAVVDSEGNVRSVVQPYWIFKQFLSPVMGIDAWMRTGDVDFIRAGFWDAFTAIPTSVTRIWDEAQVTSDALLAAAKEQDGLLTPESQSNMKSLLINSVGVYEKALFEQSFAREIRLAFDDYARNPWIIPDTNKFGDIKRDPNTWLPLAGNAQARVVDLETGEITTEYLSRDDNDARLHQYAANNLNFAAMASLFTGQWSMDSTYFRRNMVPRQETIYKPEISQTAAEAILQAALEGMRRRGEGYATVTQYEIETYLKEQASASGGWWNASDIQSQAKEIVKDYGANQGGGFSLLEGDKGVQRLLSKSAKGKLDGTEGIPMQQVSGQFTDPETGQLTYTGAMGVLEGLRKGVVQLGDESLVGVSISVPMRQAIQEEWVEELIQEGIDMGLPESIAKTRANRIWTGDHYLNPNAKGLSDLLWDDRIDWNTKATYNQLNTTFVIGPNGKPWATPFTRGNLLGAFGIPAPTRVWQDRQGLGKDIRGNTVDPVLGINTGLAALERVEFNGKLEKPDDKIAAFDKSYTPTDASLKKSGSGWVNYPRRSWGSGWKNYGKRSSGYSYGSSGYVNFNRMYDMPDTRAPYANSTPFINTTNPILRRANVRRERISSSRGRLKQWQ